MGYIVKNYTEQGGEKTVINGEIIINGKIVVSDNAQVVGIERNPYILQKAKPDAIGGIKEAANIVISDATTISGLKDDFNNLLVKLKTAGVIAKDQFNTAVIAIPTPVGEDIVTNHSKVESITYAEGLVIVKVPVDDLVAFDAGSSGEGIHKWLGLSIATGLESIIGVIYNGSYSLAQIDVDEATAAGCQAGSFVLWIKCDELITTPKVITISKPGFETVTISIIVE